MTIHARRVLSQVRGLPRSRRPPDGLEWPSQLSPSRFRAVDLGAAPRGRRTERPGREIAVGTKKKRRQKQNAGGLTFKLKVQPPASFWMAMAGVVETLVIIWVILGV